MTGRNPADRALRLHPDDNVVVLKQAVKAGDVLLTDGQTIVAARNVAAGHKLAFTEIADEMAVRKYGQIIGFARGRIAPGDRHPAALQFGISNFASASLAARR